MRSAAALTRIYELRLDWGFIDRELVLDATMTVFDYSGGEIEGPPARVALCHGASVWQPFSDCAGFEPEALAWLHGDQPSPALPHPGDLTDGECVELWRKTLTRRLALGFGADALAQLHESARRLEHLVRIVVRPRDPVAARLPVETLCWLDGPAPQEHPISVLRLPVRLTAAMSPPRFASREPGVYSATMLRAYDSSDEELGGLTRLMEGFEDADGLLKIACGGMRRQLDGLDDNAVAAAQAADLVVVGGHGTADCALLLPGGGRLDADAISGALVDGPSCVLLAICRSATAPPPDSERLTLPSLAEAIAERGPAVTIGFQRDEVDKTPVRVFAETAFSALGPLLVEPEHTMSLLDWELALCETRLGRAGLDPIAPVAFVHPSLLDGVPAERATPPRTLRRSRHLVTGEAEATCWYVPGQLTCFAASSHPQARQLRVPLPVDCGVDLRVALSRGCHADPNERGDHHTLTIQVLKDLARAFELDDALGITVELSARPVDMQWANETAELSAAIRALSAITRRRAPDAALELLYALRQWGAPDGAPRVIDISTGRPVARLAGWPSLIVAPQPGVAPFDPPVNLGPGLPHGPPLALLEPLTAETVKPLIRMEYRRLNASSGPEGLRAPARMDAVANPGEAVVRAGDCPDGRVVTARVRRREVRGSDELYRSGRRV